MLVPQKLSKVITSIQEAERKNLHEDICSFLFAQALIWLFYKVGKLHKQPKIGLIICLVYFKFHF